MAAKSVAIDGRYRQRERADRVAFACPPTMLGCLPFPEVQVVFAAMTMMPAVCGSGMVTVGKMHVLRSRTRRQSTLAALGEQTGAVERGCSLAAAVRMKRLDVMEGM